MATYLVTGATGFLGRPLVDRLREAEHEVVALVRREDSALVAKGVRLISGDVLDADSVKTAAEGCDGLFHLAGMVSRDPDDTQTLWNLHVKGTDTTLNAAYAAGIRRVVYMSTSGTVAVSDDREKICTEDDETPIGIIQRWPYYRSKLFAEQKALDLGESLDDLEVVSLNPTLLLGPGDERGSSTDDVRLFLEGKVPAVPPGGLSFVDVRDTADACLRAMRRGKAGERYLLGSCNLTLREFFRRLGRLSGLEAPVVNLPRASFLRDATVRLAKEAKRLGAEGELDPISLEMAHYYWYLDATKAERELGFSARDPLDTLADTVDDLYNRGVVAPRAEPLANRFEQRGREVFDRLFDRLRAN